MGARALLAALGFLAACAPHVEVPESPKAEAVPAYVVIPKRMEWDETVSIGNLELPTTHIRQVWVAEPATGDRTVYDITETETFEPGNNHLRARYQAFVGPEGFGYLASEDLQTGVVTPWDPPEIVLPPAPQPGATWTAHHTKGDHDVERSCELMASNLCPRGLVSVCESRVGDARTVVRDHFCPDAGWSGFEALHIVGAESQRRWSDAVVRDGADVW